MKYKIRVFAALFVCFTTTVTAEINPDDFFQDYIKLGESFDPKVAQLYDDVAKIHAYRVYPHGLERSMSFTGAQWKLFVQKIMPLAKANNDKNTFSEIRISKVEGGYKVKAKRYSDSKCYTDTGYYMILKRQDDGGLAIFEEYMETKPLSNC